MAERTEKDRWDAIAPIEEVDRDDERINRLLRWREIERHLEGVETILDVGAGAGAFSVPLAERGYRVTHFDISSAMIERARAKAGGRANIAFIEGSADDLSLFAARSFDLVLNMDGAVSFAGARAEAVLAASCAVTKRTFLTTVSNKACMVATWIKYSLVASGRILPAVHELVRTGLWDEKQFAENALIFPKHCVFPTLKCFARAELAGVLERNGLTVVTTRSIGSLTHLLLPHAVTTDAAEFLDLCEAYDTDIVPDGPGSFRRAGLLAVAKRE